MKIAFVGTAGSGKDYAASILVRDFAFRRVAFADRLKVVAFQVLSDLDDEYNGPFMVKPISASKAEQRIAWIDERKGNPAMRGFLQALGVVTREFIHAEYWVDYALTTVKGYEDSFGPQNWVLTDCRFENEAAALRADGFQIVRVVRNGNEYLNRELSQHVSETEQNGIQTDFVLYNPGTPEAYESRVETLVAEVAERLGLPGTEPVNVS